MLALAAAITCAGRPKRAAAQVARTGDPDTVVVTGTRTPEQITRASVKTDVVTRAEAEQRGATNVAEALQSQAGVQVNPGAYGFLGGVSAIQIQGFDRDRVLVLEDGERIVGDVGGAIDLASIPTADIARIEIVAGPTSSLYGTSAIGGVVNVVTAPPARAGFGGRFRGEGRTQPGYVLQANGVYRRDDVWVGLDGNAVGSDGISGREGLPDLTIPNSARRMIGLRGGLRIHERIDLRARLRLFDDETKGLESTTAPGLGRYLTDLPNHTRRYTVHVIENVDLGHKSTLRITVGKQFLENETTRDRRDSPLDEIRNRHHGMQSIEGVATIVDGPRTWVMGTRFEAEKFSQSLTKTESLSTGPSTNTAAEVPAVLLGSGAVYGQVAWKLGERFTLLPGVRGEGHSRYGTAVAPRLALSWRPTDAWVLRFSGGRGFRTPSAKELGFIFDHSVYGYAVTGNPDLRPETSWGTNADATFTPKPWLVVRGAGFANWIDDLIDIDLGSGQSSGTVAQYTYTNFGRARTFGGQASLGVKPLKGVRVDAAYDYVWTRDDLNDRPLGGRPPHTFTASVQASLPVKLEAYGRFRVASDAFLDETSRSPGWSTLDLRLGREVWPRSQAYVGALNVFDVKQEPGRVGDTRPPLGRVVYLGLRAEFPWEDP